MNIKNMIKFVLGRNYSNPFESAIEWNNAKIKDATIPGANIFDIQTISGDVSNTEIFGTRSIPADATIPGYKII